MQRNLTVRESDTEIGILFYPGMVDQCLYHNVPFIDRFEIERLIFSDEPRPLCKNFLCATKHKTKTNLQDILNLSVANDLVQFNLIRLAFQRHGKKTTSLSMASQVKPKSQNIYIEGMKHEKQPLCPFPK